MVMKPIPNYEGLYSATDDGQIYSEKSKKFLKPSLDHKGYLRVDLYRYGKAKHYLIHRLIAMTFLENPNGLPAINHKDENKLNNCVDNLEYCTIKYNNTYGSRIAKCSKPVYCVELNKIFPSIKAAGRELGISSGGLCVTLNKNSGKCCYAKYHFEYTNLRKELDQI